MIKAMKTGRTVPTATYRTLLEVANAFFESFTMLSIQAQGDPKWEAAVKVQHDRLTKEGWFDLLDQTKYLSDNLAPTAGRKVYHR